MLLPLAGEEDAVDSVTRCRQRRENDSSRHEPGQVCLTQQEAHSGALMPERPYRTPHGDLLLFSR